MKKLPPNQKRKIVVTKWNTDEKDMLDLLAYRRDMNRSEYLRWLVTEAYERGRVRDL